jgi:hypothetical protein
MSGGKHQYLVRVALDSQLFDDEHSDGYPNSRNIGAFYKRPILFGLFGYREENRASFNGDEMELAEILGVPVSEIRDGNTVYSDRSPE